MKERYLSKTPFLTFVYISKCNINLPCYFGNSKKRFLWTGLVNSLLIYWHIVTSETYFILFLPVYAANNCLKVLVDYRLETSSYLLVHCHLMNSFLMLLPVYTCTVHCLLIFLSWVKTESIMSFKGERQWYTAKKARTFYVHSHLDRLAFLRFWFRISKAPLKCGL